MLTPSVRLLSIVLALALGGWQLTRGDSLGWAPIAAAGLLAVGYWRHATVWLAFQAYRRGDVDGIDRHLRTICSAKRLSLEAQAYFHFLHGVVAQSRADLPGAEKSLLAAAAGRFRTGNMHSIVHYHLSAVALSGGEKSIAKSYLDEARRWPHTTHVAAQLDALERQLLE